LRLAIIQNHCAIGVGMIVRRADHLLTIFFPRPYPQPPRATASLDRPVGEVQPFLDEASVRCSLVRQPGSCCAGVEPGVSNPSSQSALSCLSFAPNSHLKSMAEGLRKSTNNHLLAQLNPMFHNDECVVRSCTPVSMSCPLTAKTGVRFP
jgi:hypothetical protein